MTTDQTGTHAACDFPTLDVVSSTTGILVCDIGGIYAVLGHVLGDDLMTHQLPAASFTARPHIEAQHPWLADLDPPRGDLPALQDWAARILDDYGPVLALTRATEAAWRRGNALQDIADLADGRAILAVEIDSGCRPPTTEDQ